jgi:hypothetical protein
MSALVPADRTRSRHPGQPGTFGPGSCGAVNMNRFCRSACRQPGPVPASSLRRTWVVGDHVPCPIIHLSMPRSAETMEVSDATRT